MAEVDVSQIKASGPGLNGGKTGKKNIIHITGAPKSVLEDGLSYSTDGPTKPDILSNSDTEDGSVELSYVALVPGDYKITIRYKGRQITGSPFKATITGDVISAEKLISKVNINVP